MSDFPTISLDTDWLYLFAENHQADYSAPRVDDSGWIPLPELADWTVATSAHTGADWFRRRITLAPLDGCVRYTLSIERAPEALVVYVNGKKLGEAQSPFRADVTALVALGDNIIALRLIPGAERVGGGFGHIRLQSAPCD